MIPEDHIIHSLIITMEVLILTLSMGNIKKSIPSRDSLVGIPYSAMYIDSVKIITSLRE